MKVAYPSLAVVFALAPVVATAGMRCGTQLVLEGYDFDRVSELCGEADSTYPMGERYIYQSVRDANQQASIAEVIKLDVWVYRGTDNEFSRKLYFENGVLVKIETGER